MPDDWPVLQHYLVMPNELAEELGKRSGPPNGADGALGNELVKAPPLAISYLYGDQAAFDRAYVSAADVQMLIIDGQEIEVQRQAGNFPLPRYVFNSEDDPLRWVIVEDVVSEFPGREEQAGEVFGVLDGILMTMSLDD